MSEPNAHNSNVQHLVIGGCAYEIHSIFGNKIKLEDIIAQRVRKELEKESYEKDAELTCFSASEERSCIGK